VPAPPGAAWPGPPGSQRARLVAHLARTLGLAHWALAEDAVQQACLQALTRWPVEGRPANEMGWLYRVAHHAAIDSLRRAGRDDPWPEDPDTLPLAVPEPRTRLAGELDDDELALLFAACHPALPPATQLALALRAGTSLELAAIAEGLLCSEAALAQRLARARTLLREASLEIPAGAALVPRRDAVLHTLQLMFSAGLKASGRVGAGIARAADAGGAGPVQAAMALCWEAIRLARALAAHPATASGEADALAALLLLHGARLSGRLDERGDIIPLPGQPRDRWDGALVRLGYAHLEAARRATRLTAWHLQAGIAAEHARAPDYASTDWPAIVQYYTLLLQLDDSPAPRLGHAIALAESGEARRALQLLQALWPSVPAPLGAHTLAAMARAHERLGEVEAACRRLREAIGAVHHAADARLLQQRLDRLAGAA
jgi:RNA polymerase sigma-70 factor, ECF subfamily